MLKQFWNEVPRMLKVSTVVSFVLVAVVSLVAGIIKGVSFGLESGITGGFSVALLCVYVVCVGRIMLRVKHADDKKVQEAAATSAVSSILELFLIKFVVLAAALVVSVVVLHFNVFAAVVGVSGVYLPLLVVPHIVKSAPEEGDSTEDTQKPEV